MTSRKCYDQKDCQGLLQSKGLPETAAIKRTAGECYNLKDCQGVLQSKVLPERATIKRTARDRYNLKDCQGMLGSGSTEKTVRSDIIKSNARTCYN